MCSGGWSRPVSSPATDIAKQPPWAEASSSSGLVFPSGFSTREASEYGSASNAPVAPVIDPAPRARFPSQLTRAVRSIRGTSLPFCLCRSAVQGGRAVGVVGLGGRAGRAEDRAEAQLLGARVLEAVDEPRRKVDARARPER